GAENRLRRRRTADNAALLMLGAGLILFLAALQGATELFPVSSLGHAVVVPPLLHLDFRESDPAFVPILTVLHLGTAAALIVLYRQQWGRVVKGFARAAIRGRISGPDERLAMLLLVGTIPAGLVGFFLENQLKARFADPRLASALLMVNGAILLTAEWFRRRDERRRQGRGSPAVTHEPGDPGYAPVESLTLRAAVIVGLSQVGALFPGISRAGVT